MQYYNVKIEHSYGNGQHTNPSMTLCHTHDSLSTRTIHMPTDTVYPEVTQG